MEASQILIARRRNQHNKNGKIWCQKLLASTGIEITPSDFVDPFESMLREHARKGLLIEGLNRGWVQRRQVRSLADATKLWSAAMMTLACPVVIDLFNHADFSFHIHTSKLEDKFAKLILFDADTVSASTRNPATAGISIDSIDSDCEFEIDIWNQNSQPANRR